MRKTEQTGSHSGGPLPRLHLMKAAAVVHEAGLVCQRPIGLIGDSHRVLEETNHGGPIDHQRAACSVQPRPHQHELNLCGLWHFRSQDE